MRRKTLSLLAPIAAIMAFAVVPVMASAAEDEIQGTEFTASNGNLVIENEVRNIECNESILQFQEFSPSQALVIGGSLRNSPTNIHCSAFDWRVILQSNAATVGWFFQTGEQGPGVLQGALGAISFTAHFWLGNQGGEIAQCTFTQNGPIPVEYEQEVVSPQLSINGKLSSDYCGSSYLRSDFSANGLFIH